MINAVQVAFSNYAYLLTFIASFPVIFYILRGSRLNEFFKSGKTTQNKLAYVFICIVFSHVVAYMVKTLLEIVQIA